MTSSPQLLTPLTSLAPGADFTHLLGGPSDNDDLLVSALLLSDTTDFLRRPQIWLLDSLRCIYSAKGCGNFVIYLAVPGTVICFAAHGS